MSTNSKIFHIHYPDIDECVERKPCNVCVNVPGGYKCVGNKNWAVVMGKSVNVYLRIQLTLKHDEESLASLKIY